MNDTDKFVYMLLPDGAEWEDIIIILDKTEAIKASIDYSKLRVEIFKKNSFGYAPTYDYYKNGQLIKND